jgi:hypothetical protein
MLINLDKVEGLLRWRFPSTIIETDTPFNSFSQRISKIFDSFSPSPIYKDEITMLFKEAESFSHATPKNSKGELSHLY